MTKIYYNKSLFQQKQTESCERVLCIPFEDPSLFKEDAFENGRFDEVIEHGKEHIQYVSIEECDYVLIPFKYKHTVELEAEILNAKEHSKQVLVIYNDDATAEVDIEPHDGFIFRTSFYKSNRKKNEYAFPAFCGDFFKTHGGYFITEPDKMKTIGFCGAITHELRAHALNALHRHTGYTNNFIIRQSFLAQELPKNVARQEYIDHMKANCFNLCVRGAGNFSYRFYETMMMGRIPIVVDSDMVLPFAKKLDYPDSCVIVRQTEMNMLPSILDEWVKSKSDSGIVAAQKRNRELWEKYLSAFGWIQNFKLEINTMNLNNWSIDENVLNWISKNLEPGKTILEFGSGNATDKLSRDYIMYSVEEDKDWLDRFNSNYIYAPIKDDYYSLSFLRELPKHADMIIVDGPAHGSRMGFVDNFDKIDPVGRGCKILVFDDVDRDPDFECYKKILDAFESKGINIETEVRETDRNKKFAFIKII